MIKHDLKTQIPRNKNEYEVSEKKLDTLGFESSTIPPKVRISVQKSVTHVELITQCSTLIFAVAYLDNKAGLFTSNFVSTP